MRLVAFGRIEESGGRVTVEDVAAVANESEVDEYEENEGNRSGRLNPAQEAGWPHGKCLLSHHEEGH